MDCKVFDKISIKQKDTFQTEDAIFCFLMLFTKDFQDSLLC